MILKELITKINNKIKSVDDKHTPVLLWENASPNSSFSPQNINISTLSNYKYIKIVCYFSTNWGGTTITGYVICENAARVKIQGSYQPNSSLRIIERDFIVGDTLNYIQVAAGKYFTNTASAQTDNTDVVPYEIYGIEKR